MRIGEKPAIKTSLAAPDKILRLQPHGLSTDFGKVIKLSTGIKLLSLRDTSSTKTLLRKARIDFTVAAECICLASRDAFAGRISSIYKDLMTIINALATKDISVTLLKSSELCEFSPRDRMQLFGRNLGVFWHLYDSNDTSRDHRLVALFDLFHNTHGMASSMYPVLFRVFD